MIPWTAQAGQDASLACTVMQDVQASDLASETATGGLNVALAAISRPPLLSPSTRSVAGAPTATIEARRRTFSGSQQFA
jgi:hypothetical protein